MTRLPRNPGPPLGYQFLRWYRSWAPRWLFSPCLWGGTAIAVARMHKERHASREYLRIVLEREPSQIEIINHFYALACSLVDKMCMKGDSQPSVQPAQDADTQSFLSMARSGEQALFGTFHVGHSDQIGASLCTLGRQVHMVRLQVRNSPDTRALQQVAGDNLQFVWVNQPEELLFTIHHLLSNGATLAMQCDRIKYGSKHHAFDFLGAKRLFPVTIYHLAHLFQLPVGFALSVPQPDGTPLLVSSGVFRPDPQSRKRTLEQGCKHFQRTLTLLESHLRRNPYIWFNFLPLNPEVKDADAAASGATPATSASATARQAAQKKLRPKTAATSSRGF